MMGYRRTADPRHLFAGLMPEGCWEWSGPRSDKGYGLTKYRMRQVRAHRLTWELLFGPIPDGMRVCHTCDNPPCCRPNHLFLGTDADNVHDAQAKGRRKSRQINVIRPNAKLTSDQVAQIRARYLVGADRQVDLAAEFGVSQSIISRVVRGVYWR